MKFTEQNVKYRPLIGLRVTIIDCTDPSLIGATGLILEDRDRSLVILRTDTSPRRKITVMKAYGCKFSIETCDGSFVVKGEEILGRPSSRIKRWL